MASPLSQFTDLFKAVGNYYMTGPDKLINDAADVDYEVLKRMLSREVDEVVKGGKRLTDDIILDESNTAEEYLPNPTFSYQNPQVMTEAVADWRFVHDHMMWTKHEIMLSVGNERAQTFKRLMLSKEIRVANSTLKKIKQQRFATPQTTLMESQSGTSPYSLACVANEFVGTTDNGLSTGYTTGTLQTQFHPGTLGDATEWSTFQNISIASKAAWRNKVTAYDTREPGVGKNNIFRAMRHMWQLLNYRSPPTMTKYFEDETFRRMAIATTLLGWLEACDLIANSGDNVKAQNSQDFSYLNPMFGGIPIEKWDGLATATWYPSAANVTTGAVTTEGAAFIKGPRFNFYNFNFLKLVFHEDSYWDRSEPRMANGNQPYTQVVDIDSWSQQWCHSRRHHGVVMPLAAAGYTAY